MYDKITVEQFQQIYALTSSKMTDEEKIDNLLGIMYGYTSEQIGNMLLTDYKKKVKECAVLLTGEIPGKPVKYIKVETKKYAINYRIDNLRQRQYVEVLHYAKDPVNNMHLLMASIVQPVKFTVKLKNDVKKHQQIAADMLKAKITDVYHTCVFFCKLYISSIKAIRPYLEKEIMTTMQIEKSQATKLLDNLTIVLDGFFLQKKLPILKELV